MVQSLAIRGRTKRPFSADHPLAESEDVRILQENGRHSLIISHVTNDDEGFYTVTATNSHGEAECSAELYIQEPRPAISSQMYDHESKHDLDVVA